MGAVLTKPGCASTARWGGSGEQAGEEYVRTRLDALVAATSYADHGHIPTTPETGVLLTVAEAAVRRRPLAITYRDKNDRSTERGLEPYGADALRGRWYATDWTRAAARCAPSGWTGSRAVAQEGRFSVPGGFDPAAQVTGALGDVVQAHGLGAGPRQREGGADADARIGRHHRAAHWRTGVGAGAMARAAARLGDPDASLEPGNRVSRDGPSRIRGGIGQHAQLGGAPGSTARRIMQHRPAADGQDE